MADEIVEIADNATPQDAHVARLKVDARKWVAAKLLPKKYGDRPAEVNVNTQINLGFNQCGRPATVTGLKKLRMTKSKKNKNKGKLPLARFKQSLTVVGRNLSKSLLIRVRGAVNYLWVGRWMADRGFVFPEQVSVSDRTEVFVSIARRVADKKVLYLEFGVAAGETMRWWSSALKNPGSKLHGFDSFEGLPEATWFWTKGEFSTGGKAPKIDDPRISFYVGLFDQTLPAYQPPPHDQLVVNLDADLYSSTIFVLRTLRPHLKSGTYVYFDEMNHVDHEPRAFDEFVAESGLKFRPICADRTLTYVAFEIA